jgi:hypothetical protein
LKFSQKQKVENKQVADRWKEWVQSGNFAFNEGSIIYDRDVSGLKTWEEKLASIGSFVVLGKTMPVTLRNHENEATDLKQTKRDPGLVTFKIYAPKPPLGFICISEVTKTQDEFVRFAISGESLP